MRNYIKCTKFGLTSVGLLCLSLSMARATVIDNFVGEFAPSQWTLEPGYPVYSQGTAAFVNSATELDIVGPTGYPNPSYDSVSIVGPNSPGGVPTPVTFTWAFNAGDAASATASISWAGEPGGNPLLLASGGEGTSESGMVTLDLAKGDTLTILLDNGPTGAGKEPASLDITQFSYAVPDSTPWIEASLLLPLLLVRRFSPLVRRNG